MCLIDYEVTQPGQWLERQVYDVNFLKQWHAHKGYLMAPYPDQAEFGPSLKETASPEGLVFGEHLSLGLGEPTPWAGKRVSGSLSR